MRRPPLVVILVGLFVIALGETAGAVISQLAGSAEYDTEVTARALYAVEAGLSFFHTHAQGLGPLVILVGTIGASVVPWRRARGALYALLAVGALFPLGYLVYSVAVLERGRESGIEMAERYVLTPLGSALIVGLVALAALIVAGRRRGPAA